MGSVIGKLNVGGTTHVLTSTLYGTCNTTAGSAEKIVILSDNNITTTDWFNTGIHLCVKFTYGNIAENPTLTIKTYDGNTTLLAAKKIYQYGTTISANTGQEWVAGEAIELVYDANPTPIESSGGWIIVRGSRVSPTVNLSNLGFGFYESNGDSSIFTTNTQIGSIIGVYFTGTNTSNYKIDSTVPLWKNYILTANLIQAGDTAIFMKTGSSQWRLLSVYPPHEIFVGPSDPNTSVQQLYISTN